jgi:NAD(P)-dependent dehydrogenase (short-subunit alcohol dehydrogenase family)
MGRRRQLEPGLLSLVKRLSVQIEQMEKFAMSGRPSAHARFRREAEKTAARERGIQRKIDRKDDQKPKEAGSKKPMQAGAREYPAPPLPRQHLSKPGVEAELELAPMYDAPHYKGSEKLLDRVALVTGGDSGIGRAVAVLFAREGADVAVCYLNEHEDAEETKRAVEKEGRACIVISGDVADPEFCKAAVARTVESLGGLDILVNNAAFQEHAERLEDLSEEHFDRTIKTNLYGYFHMAKAAVPHMKPGSAIVMTGSVTGLLGNKELLDYSMTKGGIYAFARSLAAHLVDRGIRVNAVAPGPVWTPLNPADKAAERVAKFGGDTPMRRPARSKAYPVIRAGALRRSRWPGKESRSARSAGKSRTHSATADAISSCCTSTWRKMTWLHGVGIRGSGAIPLPAASSNSVN